VAVRSGIVLRSATRCPSRQPHPTRYLPVYVPSSIPRRPGRSRGFGGLWGFRLSNRRKYTHRSFYLGPPRLVRHQLPPFHQVTIAFLDWPPAGLGFYPRQGLDVYPYFFQSASATYGAVRRVGWALILFWLSSSMD